MTSDDVRVVCRLSGPETFGYTFEVEAGGQKGFSDVYRLKLTLSDGRCSVTPWASYEEIMWMEVFGRLFVCVSQYHSPDCDGFRMLHPMEAIKVVGSGVVVR